MSALGYSIERRERAINLMLGGLSAKEAGRRVGVADTTVGEWWRRHQDAQLAKAICAGRAEPRQPFPGHCWRVVASMANGCQRYSLIPRGHATPFGTVIASEWVPAEGARPELCYHDMGTTAHAGSVLPIHATVLRNMWRQVAGDKQTAGRFVTAAVAMLHGRELLPCDATAANRAASVLQDDGWFRYCRTTAERIRVAELVAKHLLTE